MKRVCFWASLAASIFAAISPVKAQSVDLNIGFGSAHVGSTGAGIDGVASPNAFGTCSLSAGDESCQSTPSLNGFFLGFGGDVMLRKHFGVGAEVNFQPSKNDYGPVQYRQTFYDFNAIVAPINEKRMSLRFQGGIGGARTGFSFSESACVGDAVCTTTSQPIGNANHFQVHTGVGLQVYLTSQLYIRPEFDLHYVHDLNQQFGSNWAPQGVLWVGYSWGGR
jgi:hypothetical protein